MPKTQTATGTANRDAKYRAITQRLDPQGYIKGVSCHTNHGGNRGLVFGGGYAECQGCGMFLSVDEVWRALESRLPPDMYTGRPMSLDPYAGKAVA